MAREFLTVSCTQLRPDAAPTPAQSRYNVAHATHAIVHVHVRK